LRDADYRSFENRVGYRGRERERERGKHRGRDVREVRDRREIEREVQWK
jgi:hypothetical protein